MTASVRQLKPKAARRPAARTVSITLEGDFEGWQATARADFPARWLAELDPNDMPTFTTFMDRIVISHNLPDSNDEVASSMADVDPYDGLIRMGDAIVEAIAKLPKR